MIVSRRTVMAGVAALSLPVGRAKAATDFPSRPLRFLVGFSAGGGVDVVARIVAQGLSEMHGWSVVTENKTGASGLIAAQEVARNGSDGYALLVGTQTNLAVAPQLMNSSFAPLRELAPVILIGSSPLVLLANPSLPARNLEELVKLAKERPGQIEYASGGFGTTTHMTAELFCAAAGIKLWHVVYRGDSPALLDIVGGRIPLMFTNLSAALPFVTAGTLRALAVTGSSRDPLLPDVPTVGESGYPSFAADTWFGLAAAAAAPRDVVEQVNRAVGQILSSGPLRQKLAEQGVRVIGGTPAQFASYLQSEHTKWGSLIRDAGLTMKQ